VLNIKLQPARLSDITWAHVSLTLVGLMWAFPFLHYRHENPLTSFDQEWWSAVLGLLAIVLLIGRKYWQPFEIPRIVQFPAALIAVVLLQLALSKVPYFGQALVYAMYFMFAALLMLLGARLRDCFGLASMARVLATFLLIGASLDAVIGVLQHFHWHTFMDSMITAKSMRHIYGNLAQHNHFANYIALGLISLGLLFQQGKLKAIYVGILAALLLFVMMLSGSRSSWLYLLMMSGMAWWFARRDAALRPLLTYCLSLLAGFGLVHLIVQLPFMAGADSTNTVERIYSELLSNDAGTSSTLWMKFYMWHEAWLMFMQSPWVGVGFGQYAWNHFQLLPVLRANYIWLLQQRTQPDLPACCRSGLRRTAGVVWIDGNLDLWAKTSDTRSGALVGLWSVGCAGHTQLSRISVVVYLLHCNCRDCARGIRRDTLSFAAA
jgi:O-antigen ligase